jgi:hypothetical protein
MNYGTLAEVIRTGRFPHSPGVILISAFTRIQIRTGTVLQCQRYRAEFITDRTAAEANTSKQHLCMQRRKRPLEEAQVVAAGPPRYACPRSTFIHPKIDGIRYPRTIFFLPGWMLVATAGQEIGAFVLKLYPQLRLVRGTQ